MKANMGSADRVIRVIAGLVIVGVGWDNHSWWALVGLLPILTAVVGFCPGYLPFGFSTRKPDDKEPPIPPGGPKAA